MSCQPFRGNCFRAAFFVPALLSIFIWVFLSFSFLFQTPLSVQAAGEQWLTGWTYRKPITLHSSQVSGTLTDFPVYIGGTDADLASKALANGNDIVFTAADGQTVLDYEIETYLNASGALVSWVKLPSLSSAADTTIYLYYGKSDAVTQADAPNVWSNGYEAVFHLADGTTDSTGKHPGTDSGTSASSFGNGIGYSREWNASSDRITFGNWNISGDKITLQSWYRLDTLGVSATFVGRSGGISSNEETAAWIGGGTNISNNMGAGIKTGPSGGSGSSFIVGNTAMSFNTWQFGTFTYDGSAMNLYMNGQSIATPVAKTQDLTSLTWIWSLGNFSPNYLLGMDGFLDEARVSSVARSADWIATEYQNISAPGSFFTIGSEETYAPPISLSITSDGSIQYGKVAAGQSKSTVTLVDTQTASNSSAVAVDLNIKTSSATGGTTWAVGSSAGSDTFVHEFSINGGTDWTQFTAADVYQTLVSNLASGGTQNFDLRFTAPTSSSDYAEKSITVTIQAVQHE